MNNEQLYQRWQAMFEGLVIQLKGKFDPRIIYASSLPTFVREKLARVEGSDTLEPGLTRLEWLPDLPPGAEWPQDEGKAMDFVAQVNLADLEAGFHPLLPASGWLYFFVGDFWDKNVIPHRVLYFDGSRSELVRTAPPSQADPPEKMSPETALVRFYPGFSIDPKFIDKIHPWGFDHDPKYEVLRDLEFPLLEGYVGETTRIGGYMYTFQGGGQDRYARLFLNGYEALIRHGYLDVPPLFRDEKRKEQYYRDKYEQVVKAGDLERLDQEAEKYNEIHEDIDKHTEPIEMLFGLESTMGRCWGDVGFLEFFIRQDDLANRNFDRTYCDVLST